MKKLVPLLCALLLLLCTGMSALAVEVEPTIEFEINNTYHARICTYTFPNGGVLYFAEPLEEREDIIPGWSLYKSENLQGEIVIPEYIEGKPVSRLHFENWPNSIGPHVSCLLSNPEMTSITFPSTLREIAGVSVNADWFEGCSKLEEIIFTGDGPEKLDRYFFGSIPSLKRITLPKKVADIAGAFESHYYRSKGLESIVLDPENPHFVMDEQGILYTADKTTVITAIQGAAERKTVTLPDSVHTIRWGAFAGCTQLERIFGGNSWIKGFDKGEYTYGHSVVEQCPALNPFQDTYGHWSESVVKWAYDEGIMNGQSSRTFSPDTMVNRGMACTILYRFAGLETDGDNGAASPFPDVPRDAYYGPAVAWAAGEDIVQGYDDGLFHPADSITREQLAAILYRYASPLGEQNGPGPELGSFEDAGDVSEYAQEAIAWAVSAGLMQGKGGSRLDPQGLATRAEMAAVMQRLQALS